MLQTQWFLCLLIQIGSKYKETLRTVPNQLMYVYVSFFSKMLIEYVQVVFTEKIVSERQYILLASIKFIWFIVFVLLKRMSAGDNTKELMIGGTTCQTFFFKYKQQDRTMQPSYCTMKLFIIFLSRQTQTVLSLPSKSTLQSGQKTSCLTVRHIHMSL